MSEPTLRDIQKHYASRALVLALAVGAALIVFGFKPVGKGLILGTLFSALNFVILGELLPGQVARARRRAVAAALGGKLLRLALLAVPLVVAARRPEFDLRGVVPGLFTVQLLILWEHGVRARKRSGRPVREG